MKSNNKDPKKKKSTGEINTHFNIGLQHLKGMPYVATGLKGIKESTQKIFK